MEVPIKATCVVDSIVSVYQILLKQFWVDNIIRTQAEVKVRVDHFLGVTDRCLFSMDYKDKAFSEYENISAMSSGIHYTMICNDAMFEKYAQLTAKTVDDPKAGSSYTNYALTELASKFCTVLYSGAGGDELFGGYPHRNNKPVKDVIKRTDTDYTYTSTPTHDEYNWKFMEGVLVVEDRIASAFTMETRFVLLDNDFVNFARSLPDEYLKDKRILKDISNLPEKVVSSKKTGWSNPHCTNKEWTNLTLNG